MVASYQFSTITIVKISQAKCGFSRMPDARSGPRRSTPGCPTSAPSRCGAHRQACDVGTRLLQGNTDIIGALEIEPELRTGAEPVPKAKSGVASDRALALDDLGDAVRRHLDLSRQLRRRHRDLRKFFGEDFPGMDGRP